MLCPFILFLLPPPFVVYVFLLHCLYLHQASSDPIRNEVGAAAGLTDNLMPMSSDWQALRLILRAPPVPGLCRLEEQATSSLGNVNLLKLPL